MIKRLTLLLTSVLALILGSGLYLSYIYYHDQWTVTLYTFSDDICVHPTTGHKYHCNTCYTINTQSFYFNCFSNLFSYYRDASCQVYLLEIPRNTCTTKLRWH